jgi:hypothetical protein
LGVSFNTSFHNNVGSFAYLPLLCKNIPDEVGKDFDVEGTMFKSYFLYAPN